MTNKNAADGTAAHSGQPMNLRYSDRAEIVKKLISTWLRFDGDPPLDLLVEIAHACDAELALEAIVNVGRAGRLRSYGADGSLLGLIRHRQQAAGLGVR